MNSKLERPKILQTFRKETLNNKSTSSMRNDIETQTDWSWIQDMQIINRLKKEGADLLTEVLNDFAESDSEESELETNQIEEKKQSPTSQVEPKSVPESVGPPKILQFHAEVKKIEIKAPSPSLSLESEPIENLAQFMSDFNIKIKGGQLCEFCSGTTKPWPSIREQQENKPDTLYCCNDYQEFVDALIQYQIEKEKATKDYLLQKESEKISLKNSKAKKLAEERAELRNMQRLIEKEKRMERLANQKLERQQQLQQLQQTKQNKIDPISNQIRSINYQLSNLKCLQDGWTVRPSTPMDIDDTTTIDEFEFNLAAVNSSISLTDKITEKELLIRKYKNDSTCLILFPDGSGNVYYPSGRVAITITQVSPGMHIMSAFTDDETNPTLIASFDPFGNGTANFPNGRVRLILSPLGGLETDSDGSRKKRWIWSQTDEHVHAPPFQPLIFTLNNNISIKVFNQEKINVNFYADNQICKFRFGSKINLPRPDVMPLNFKLDISEIYLKKKKKRIDELLKMLNNDTSLKLPKIVNNSVPKLDKPIYDFFNLTQEKSSLLKNANNKSKNRKQSSKFIIV